MYTVNAEINAGLNNCVFANFKAFKTNCSLKIVELQYAFVGKYMYIL